MIIISDLLLPLFLTILIESFVGLIASPFLKIKYEHLFISLILVNIITNLPLNYLGVIDGYYGRIGIYTIILAETIIVFIECFLLVYSLRQRYIKLFLLSAVMNLTSFLLGLKFFWLIW